MIGWKTKQIEDGDTSVPIYTQAEFISGMGRHLGVFLGKRITPFVRVPMGRRLIIESPEPIQPEETEA